MPMYKEAKFKVTYINHTNTIDAIPITIANSTIIILFSLLPFFIRPEK